LANITEVTTNHTRDQGRVFWNQNDDNINDQLVALVATVADLETDQSAALSAAVSTLNTEDDSLQSQIDALGNSFASSQALSNGSTIAVGAQRLYPVTETGNVTGVILGVGTYAGQPITVINRSAFTVTFAAEATSNVAVPTVIGARLARHFVWDAANGPGGRWVQVV
jgi:cell wall-associated NlpC family hydrolase